MIRAAIFLLLLTPAPTKADWTECRRISPGPIQRPDNYTTEPHGRRADNA